MIDIAYAMAAGGGGAQPSGPLGQFGFFPVLILIFIVFYFLIIQPQRKQEKERQDMLASLKRGDKVLTSGGIHGKIVDIKGDRVTVEVAEKVDMVFAKSHIANRLKT